MRFVFAFWALSSLAFSQSEAPLFGFLPNSGQFPPAVLFFRYASNNFNYLTRDSFVLKNGVRVQLVNINPNAQPTGESPATTIYNFYQSKNASQWTANTHLFSAVTLNNAYPGDSGEAERSFRREAERHSGIIPNAIGERSDAGFLIVREVFGFVKENLSRA